MEKRLLAFHLEFSPTAFVLKIDKKDDDLVELLEFCQDDSSFSETLKLALETGKSKNDGDSSWPTAIWRSRFMLEYNMRYGSLGTTLYSQSEYLFQLLPCLEFTYALRKAFGVPVGVGRILNADEVMTYRYDPSSRC